MRRGQGDWATGDAAAVSADCTTEMLPRWESKAAAADATQRGRVAHGFVANETDQPDASQLPLLTTYLSVDLPTALPQSRRSAWPPPASGSSTTIPKPSHRPTAGGRRGYCWEPVVSHATEQKPPNRAADAKPPAALLPGRPPEPPSAVRAEKNSRYLCERDRRTILARISRGEQQSLLAKEYQVTRAAICYLNKHRADVLARSHAHPMAKHPKKPRRTTKTRATVAASKAAISSSREVPAIVLPISPIIQLPIEVLSFMQQSQEAHPPRERPPDQDAFVHKLQSRSVALLLTTIENPTTSTAEFRRNTDRIMYLLAEEALASVAVVPWDVYISSHEHVAGMHVQYPCCAISIMPSVCPLLTTFQQLEPELPGGYAHVTRIKSNALSWSTTNSFSVDVSQTALPLALAQYNTFVLDLVAKSGPVLCAVIARLVERGAIESMITVVALFVTGDTIAMLHDQFPEVRFVVAHVDESDDLARGKLYWKRFTRSYGMRVPNDWHSQSYGF